MKTSFSKKSWFFTLSLAFIASSLWTPASAQLPKTQKVERKVTTINTTLDENVELFTSPNTQKTTKSTSCFTWSYCKQDDKKPQLGVLLKGDADGATVLKTFPNSAAAAAGLQANDKILSINNNKVASIEALQKAIASQKIGDNIAITYERDGQTMNSTATLKAVEKNHYLNRRHKFYSKTYQPHTEISSKDACEQLETIYGRPFLGVYLSNSYRENGTGALLTSIIKGTGAFKAALQAQDKIVKMNNTSIKSTQEAIAFIKSKKPGDKVRIRVMRDGKTKTIRATLGSWADSPNYQSKVKRLEAYCDENQNDEQEEEPETKTEEQATQTTPTTASFEQSVSMEVFPNPTADMVTIKYEGEKAPLTVSVIGLDGKEMLQTTIQDFDGTYNEQLDLSKYPSGVYIINLKQNDQQVSQQVVVETSY